MEFEFGTINYDAEKNVCTVALTSPTPLFEQLLTYIYESCNELANKKPYYLITIFDTEVQPTKEAYSFYSSKERTKFVLKEAFVMKVPSMKLAANFYFRVMKPHVVGMAFNNEKEGLKWLLNK